MPYTSQDVSYNTTGALAQDRKKKPGHSKLMSALRDHAEKMAAAMGGGESQMMPKTMPKRPTRGGGGAAVSGSSGGSGGGGA